MARPRRIWDNVTPNRAKHVFPIVKDETWRERAANMNLIKFDDDAKLEFLKELEESGKIGLACQAAGISYETWRKHGRLDPQFLEAVEHTIAVFNATRASKIEKQAIKGFKEVVFGPNGEKEYRTRYETQLRAMILKAADREQYEDKSQLNVNVQGGAFVVPPIMDPGEWEKQFTENQQKFVPLETEHEQLTEKTDE